MRRDREGVQVFELCCSDCSCGQWNTEELKFVVEMLTLTDNFGSLLSVLQIELEGNCSYFTKDVFLRNLLE